MKQLTSSVKKVDKLQSVGEQFMSSVNIYEKYRHLAGQYVRMHIGNGNVTPKAFEGVLRWEEGYWHVGGSGGWKESIFSITPLQSELVSSSLVIDNCRYRPESVRPVIGNEWDAHDYAMKKETENHVSEDVCEWEPATEPFQEWDVATAPNGNTWTLLGNGWWREFGGDRADFSTSTLRKLGLTVTRKKPKPSAVPSVVKGTVFNEGWRSDSHELSIRVPELGHWYDWADKPVTVILDSAIAKVFHLDADDSATTTVAKPGIGKLISFGPATIYVVREEAHE